MINSGLSEVQYRFIGRRMSLRGSYSMDGGADSQPRATFFFHRGVLGWKCFKWGRSGVQRRSENPKASKRKNLASVPRFSFYCTPTYLLFVLFRSFPILLLRSSSLSSTDKNTVSKYPTVHKICSRAFSHSLGISSESHSKRDARTVTSDQTAQLRLLSRPRPSPKPPFASID